MHKVNLLKGNSSEVVNTNVRKLIETGHSEAGATRMALRYAKSKANVEKIASKVAKPKKNLVEVK